MRAAFATTALLAVLAAAACGGNDEPATSGPVLTVGRVGDVATLDAAQATDDPSARVTREVFCTLVRFRPGTAQIVPGVARSWRVARGGTVWTFALAPGRRFSDGTRLDAAAVRFNFERWRESRDPYRGNGRFAAYASVFGGFDGASTIAAVTAPAPLTLVIRLRTPVGALLDDLALPAFGIGSPAAIARDPGAFARRPVASGPYEVRAWVPGEYVLLERNPYWNGPRPAYAAVYVRDIPDPPTTLLAMKKFDIDLLADPRPEDVAALAQTPGVRLYRVPGTAGAVSFAAKDSIDGIVASPDGAFNFISMKPKAGR